MNTNNAALALATYNTMIAAAETSAIAWRQVGIDPWASSHSLSGDQARRAA